jgi:hypothetical protein
VSSASPKSVVELRCSDAGSGSAAPNGANVSVGGLTLEALAQPMTDVPRATDLNLRIPAGTADQRFRKTPADVAMGSGPVTVELVEPAGGQALMWVPAAQWGSSLDPSRWTSAKVTFAGCPDRDATYFGGLLAPTPSSCLHLRIRPAGAPAQEQRLRLDGQTC